MEKIAAIALEEEEETITILVEEPSEEWDVVQSESVSAEPICDKDGKVVEVENKDGVDKELKVEERHFGDPNEKSQDAVMSQMDAISGTVSEEKREESLDACEVDKDQSAVKEELSVVDNHQLVESTQDDSKSAGTNEQGTQGETAKQTSEETKELIKVKEVKVSEDKISKVLESSSDKKSEVSTLKVEVTEKTMKNEPKSGAKVKKRNSRNRRSQQGIAAAKRSSITEEKKLVEEGKEITAVSEKCEDRSNVVSSVKREEVVTVTESVAEQQSLKVMRQHVFDQIFFGFCQHWNVASFNSF